MSETRAGNSPGTGELGPLRAALEAANRRAAQAEGAAGELRSRLQSETTSRIQNQEASLDRLISQAEETSGALEREWARHQADGKFEEAAAAMRRMTENSALVSRYREQKQDLAQIRAQPTPSTPSDPLASYSPAVRAWIGANPQFLSDGEFKEKAMRGHHAALAQGHPADSREYFETVERHTYPERFEAKPEAPTAQTSTNPSNPVNPSASDAPAGQVATDQSPLSQPSEQDVEVVVDHTPADRSTRSMPAQQTSRQDLDIPAGNPDADIVIDQAPQIRAVGRGGAGIASVAAPPSRNIATAAARATGGGPISISPQEMEVAMSLAEDIEPAVAQRGQIEVAKWYAALYGSPAVQRKIAKWDAR
jgi:hypothetical protein